MSKLFSTPAEKLRFIRKFITGYEAKDGWHINSDGRVLLDINFSAKKVKAMKLQYEADIKNILAATAVPYKITHSRKPENRKLINDLSGVNIKPERMKIGIVRAESGDSKIKKVYKNGYVVKEGIFFKYYFRYDIVLLEIYGPDYLHDIVNKTIPSHFEKRFKMLSSFGNAEFNGVALSLNMLSNEIMMLAGKYREDVARGAFMRAFVCYAFDPDFVDEDELELHMEDMSETRSYKQKKRRVLKRRNIEI